MQSRGPSLHDSPWTASNFQAHAGRSHETVIDEAWNILTTRGAVIDTIKNANWYRADMDIRQYPADRPDVLELADLAASINSENPKAYVTVSRLLHIITHGFLLQESRRAGTSDKMVTFDEITAFYLRVIERCPDMVQRSLNYLQAAVGRKIFQGLGGLNPRLGLAPKTAKPGDFVAILHGCSTPVIIRPEGGEYRFIGSCYYESAMFGEAVDWEEKNASYFRLI
jgi:hypothetical protein